MAFEQQTDSGSLTANAYIDVAYFKTYHDDRGHDRGTSGSADIQKAIIRATDYLDGRFNFIGEKSDPEQRTAWPRLSAEDRWGRVRTGVPHEVKEACAEYALIALTATLNPSPTLDSTGRVVQKKREKVDVIETEVEYVDGGVFKMPKYPAADSKLRGLIVRSTRLRRA